MLRRGAITPMMVFMLLVLPALAVPAQAAQPAGTASLTPAGPATTAEPVIVLLASVGPGSADSVARHAHGHGIAPEHIYNSALRGYAATLRPAQVRRLREDPSVEGVFADRVVGRIRPESGGAEAVQQVEQPAQVVSEAVSRVGGLESPTANIDGVDERVDVDIAIVDTGIQTDHPDLNVAGGVDCAGSDTPGTDWEDTIGHGTMVAGIAGALDNAIGRVGLAPGAGLWAVRVAGPEGFVRDSSLMCALEWVADHADTIEAANLSVGGMVSIPDTDCVPPHATVYQEALCAAVDAGVTVVAAGGNNARDIVESNLFPAAVPRVITVSAIADTDGQPGGLGPEAACLPGEADDTFASFSNFGAPVDLAAPGVCVDSTFIGSQYSTNSGTSFAAPLVTAAAGLYLANNPGASPLEVQDALVDLAEPGPVPGDPDELAEGILDASTL